MFTTHNLLYSERIVQFLKAQEKEQLMSAFSELTMGRAVVDLWNYFLVAQRGMTNIISDLQDDAERLKSEMANINQAIDEMGTEDNHQTDSLVEKLKDELPSDLQQDLKSLDSDQPGDLLAVLRSLGSTLGQALHHVSQFRSYVDLHGAPSVWKHVSRNFGQVKKAKESITETIHKLTKEGDETTGRLGSLAEEVESLESATKSTELDYKTLTKCPQLTSSVTNWLAELAAREKETSLKESYQAGQQFLVTGERAQKVVEHILLSDPLASLVKKKDKLRQQYSRSQGKLKKTDQSHGQWVTRLQAIDQRIAKTEEWQDQVYEIVSQLKTQLDLVKQSNPAHVCPACGHEWASARALTTAMAKQIKALSKSLATDDTKTKADAQSSLTRIEEERKIVNKEFSRLQSQLKSVEDRLEEQQQRLHELTPLLQKLGFDLPSDKQLESAKWLKDFNEVQLAPTVKDHLKNQRLKSRRMDKLWSDLRKDEFDTNQESIESDLEALQIALLRVDISIPDSWSRSDWNRIEEQIKKKLKAVKVEFEQKKKELSEVRTTQTSVKRQGRTLKLSLKKARSKNDQLDKELTLLGKAKHSVDALATLGFIGLSQQVDIDQVQRQLNSLSQPVQSLSEELEFRIKSQKEFHVLKRQLKKTRKELDRVTEELKSSSTIQQRLDRIPTLNDFEIGVWEKYSSVISTIFRQLHWPPDFEKVHLERENNHLELLVKLRAASAARVPAYERMSGGQRTALAVSVFWAFNTIPADIPDLLVMDEPIHSVDDLNMLNFLDGLRWLVQSVDRQIFISTASKSVQSLIRRKFSYLQDDYMELWLTRDRHLSRIEYRNWQGELISGEKIA